MVEAWILFVAVGAAVVFLIALVVVGIRQWDDRGDAELNDIRDETKRQVREATLESRKATSAATNTRAIERQYRAIVRRQLAERNSEITERKMRQPLTGPDLGEDVPDDPPAA